MKLQRTSILSGITRTREIDCTQEQLDDYYHNHVLLQYAFRNLSADDREFIKTGITQEEWDDMGDGLYD